MKASRQQIAGVKKEQIVQVSPLPVTESQFLLVIFDKKLYSELVNFLFQKQTPSSTVSFNHKRKPGELIKIF